jgi:calcium/calmodulin-dependent protein kinase I
MELVDSPALQPSAPSSMFAPQSLSISPPSFVPPPQNKNNNSNYNNSNYNSNSNYNYNNYNDDDDDDDSSNCTLNDSFSNLNTNTPEQPQIINQNNGTDTVMEVNESAKHWSRLLAAGSNNTTSDFISEALTNLIGAASRTRLAGSTVQYVDQRIKVSQQRAPFVWSTKECQGLYHRLRDQLTLNHAALLKPRLSNDVVLSPRSGSIRRKSRSDSFNDLSMGINTLNNRNRGGNIGSSSRRKVLLKSTPSALLSSSSTNNNSRRPFSLPTKLTFGGSNSTNGSNSGCSTRRISDSMTPSTKHSPSLSLRFSNTTKQQYGFIANSAARRASAISPRSATNQVSKFYLNQQQQKGFSSPSSLSSSSSSSSSPSSPSSSSSFSSQSQSSTATAYNTNTAAVSAASTTGTSTTFTSFTIPPVSTPKVCLSNRQFIKPTPSTTNSPIKQSTHSRINNGGRSNVDRLRNLRIHSPGRKSDFSSTYALGATLGKGTFSRVVLAQHRSTSTHFACKIVSTDVLTSPEVRALHFEIDVLKSIAHPNICNLMEYFIEDHRVCMLFELCAGGELFDAIVANDHYNERQASKIMLSLVEGIAYLHSNGIVHRDIKPENILISRSNGDLNHLKIADFGFARRCGNGNVMLSRVVGTPGYMAPEIGLMNYGLGVDVWSLGIICYILLCGYAPFEHDDNQELRNLIRAGKVQFLQGWDTVSASAKDFIMKMLVVDPNRRYDIYQVYQHPWLTHSFDPNVKGSPRQLISARTSIRKYQIRRRLKTSINVIRAVGRMSALRKKRDKMQAANNDGGSGGNRSFRIGTRRPPVILIGGHNGASGSFKIEQQSESSPLERLSLSSFADEDGRLSFCDDGPSVSQSTEFSDDVARMSGVSLFSDDGL